MSVRFLSGVNVDSNTLVVDDVNNRVGIGTASPTYTFDIVNTSSPTFRITRNGATDFRIGASILSSGALLGTYSNSPIQFLTNSTTQAVITEAGNVGIGTTSPAYKLDVNGVGSFSNGFSGPASETGYRLKFYDNGGIHNDVGIGLDGAAGGGEQMWFNALGGFYWGLGTGGTKMRLDSSGNVGIGTTSPSYKLDVSGSFRVDGTNGDFIVDSTGNDIYFTRNGTNYFIANQASSAISFLMGTGVSQSLFLKNDGNVGIGTTSPAYQLTLNKDDNNYLQIRSSDAGAAGIYFGRQNDSVRGSIYYDNNADALYFKTNNLTTSTVITSAGNVGIGITSPTKKLQIAISDAAHADEGILLQSPSGYGEGAIYHDYGQSTGLTALKLLNAYSGAQIALSQDSYSSTGSPGSLRFYTAPQAGGNTPVERMRISSVGALKLNAYGSGSNTGTATQRLAVDASGNVIEIPIGSGPVDGNGTANYITKWSDTDTITNSVIYENGGNIGIGVTNADYPLTVGSINVGAVGAQLGLILNSVINTAIPSSSVKAIIGATNSGFGYAAGSLLIQPRTGVNAVIAFATEGTEKVRITHDGNLGIGTTSPTARQSVLAAASRPFDWGDTVARGALTFSGTSALVTSLTGDLQLFTDNGATTGITVKTTSGNVGIGTTSPGYKLDVAGSINTNDVYRIGGNTILSGTTSVVVGSSGATGSVTLRTTSGDGLILNGGNVGIGTTSPSTKLHVSGSSIIATATTIDPDSYANTVIAGNIADGSGWAALGIGGNAGTGDSWAIAHNGSGLYFGIQNGSAANTMASYMEVSPSRQITLPSLATAGFLKTNASGTLSVDTTAYVNGNGTANYVTKWSDTDTITNSIIYDNGTNVGIGTTSPSYKLTVNGSIGVTSGANIIYDNYDSIAAVFQRYGGYGSVINLGRWGVSNSVTLDYPADGTFAITTNGSERFRINASGVVGIGTTSPLGLFEVKGDGVSYFTRGTKSILLNPNVVGQDTNALIDTSTGMALAFGTAGSERMRITSDGEVLIGTTTDSGNYKLQVNGRGLFQERLVINETANDTQLQILGNGTNIMSLQGRDAAGSGVSLIALNNDGGNVSIGTTAQLARTTILSDSSAQTIGLIGRSADNIATIRWWNNAGNTVYTAIESNANYTIYNTVTNGYAAFFTNNSERLRITSAGNVGIGTTAPGYKLEVNGDTGGSPVNIARFTAGIAGGGTRGMNLYSDGAQFKLQVTDNVGNTGDWAFLNLNPDGGFVGVGNTSPSQKLHVTGNVRVTGAYYDSNNSAGSSGQVLSSTGSGTDWVSLSEITGVDGTGTANYVAKWSDTDTITNSQIRDDGTTVGIGVAPAAAKLTVNGSGNIGGRYMYNNFQESLNTTGINVAGLSASTNGDSAFFTFEAGAGSGHYQRIVYSCYNAGGTWNVVKVIDEGTNAFDVVASASSGSTITFTWKSRSGTIYYTPRLIVTGVGSINTSYL